MSSISKKTVYLDNAASTPVDIRVKKEMAKALEYYGNPSSFNDSGREARKLLEDSRLKVARFIGARPEEIIFTSSGSEANNLAIFGLTVTGKREVITTKIEHLSILEPLKTLESRGIKVTYLNVSKEGFVDLKDLATKLNPKVTLVSIIYANNEIGTVQDIKKISKIIEQFNKKLEIGNWKLEIDGTQRALFHIDACQATEYLPMNINELGVDLMTFNGAKIYGPKGIGVLYKRRGINLRPLVYGGGQERDLRAGTEDLPAIVGLAKAISLINKKENLRVAKLRDYFLGRIQKEMPAIKINGPSGEDRLPNNINISVPKVDSENLLLELDRRGIRASSGSACTSHSVEPSHVLKAIGVEKEYISGALRFSLGRQTTRKELEYVLEVLPEVVRDITKRYKR